MSRVIYGVVELQIVKTNMFSQEAVFDSSGTDLIGVRCTLDVNFVINPSAVAYRTAADCAPVDAVGTFPATTTKAIRQYILTPRRTLIYEIGGVDVLRSPQLGMATDAETGPKAIRCDVWRVDGARTFMGRAVFTTVLAECCDQDEDDFSPVLSHRWSDQHQIDENFFTTRIVTGEVIFRRDILDLQNKTADDFRRTIVHPVPDRFQRRRVEVTQNPSGTVLAYRLVDEQQYLSIGQLNPATRLQCFFTTAVRYADGDNKAASRVRFVGKAMGSPNSARFDLFKVLVGCAMGRLRIGNRFGKAQDLILSAQGTESVTTPYVELDITALRVPDPDKGVPFPGTGKGRDGKPAVDGDFLAEDCGPLKMAEVRSPQPPNTAGVRGSWPANLVAAALGTPCTAVTAAPKVAQNTESAEGDDGGPPVYLVSTNTNLVPRPEWEFGYEDVTHGIYTDCHATTDYVTTEHNFQIPIAGKTTSSFGHIAPSDNECLILSYATPTTKKVVRWKVERVNGKPLLPTPRKDDPNEVLHKHLVGVGAVEVIADGETPLYSVEGEFTYYLHQSVEGGRDSIGVSPLQMYQPDNIVTFGPEDFSDDVVV